MGILDNITKRKKAPAQGARATPGGGTPARPGAGAGDRAVGGPPVGARTRGAAAAGRPPVAAGKKPGKKRGKRGGASVRERIQSAAAPLHDRRRRLVGARETTLRDLGGLMLEMYKRNRFREELLLDKCEEVLAIEVEIAHVDQRLFQLAPPNAAGMRPIGRCECGSPIHPGQNFCGVCGRSFATLTQGRSCSRCGAGLRPGDQFCATCGTEAPDALQTIEAAPSGVRPTDATVLDAPTIAASAVAETVIIAAPPLEDEQPATRRPARRSGSTDRATSSVPKVDASRPSAEAEMPAPTAPGAPAAPVTPASLVAPAASTPVTPAAAPPVAPAETPAADATPTAPKAEPRGFSWATPPIAADAAIDAAIDALPPSPTDPATPFAGFPLTSTVPPPPLVDPLDVIVPADDSTAAAPASADEAGTAEKPSRAEAKALAATERQRAKELKARAKQKARAARDARKRGGGA